MQIKNVKEGVPAPIGHYSHFVELNNGIIYFSGQKAWDINTRKLIDGDVSVQTNQIFDIIENLLADARLAKTDITRIQCHLAHANLYEQFNAVYAKRLGEHKPARAVLAGYELRGGALVELVVEAFRN